MFHGHEFDFLSYVLIHDNFFKNDYECYFSNRSHNLALIHHFI